MFFRLMIVCLVLAGCASSDGLHDKAATIVKTKIPENSADNQPQNKPAETDSQNLNTCPDGTIVPDTSPCLDVVIADTWCWNGEPLPLSGVCPPRNVCWDGSLAIPEACPSVPQLSSSGIACWDGTVISDGKECPLPIADIWCSDGRSVNSPDDCPP